MEFLKFLLIKEKEFIKVVYNQVILDFYLKETLRMEKNLQVY